jgi:hypothetical protein
MDFPTPQSYQSHKSSFQKMPLIQVHPAFSKAFAFAGARFSQIDIFLFPYPAGEGGPRPDEVEVRGAGEPELSSTQSTQSCWRK